MPDNELMLPWYISVMLVAYEMSKIPSYSKLISEILYIVLVSPVHKITSFLEFNSILIVKSS